MSETLKVIIAVHKPYDVLKDETYLPVHAGAAQGKDIGFQSDAQGETISHKNPWYCELTTLYWAYKNLESDALGLVHYRRYFGCKARCFPWVPARRRIATGEELKAYLKKTPVILPQKRNYFIESREDQYVHAHGRASLDALRSVLKARSPQYLPAFNRSMKRTSGHCFNMLVMRRDLCDAYCQWIFDTLFALEEVMQNTIPAEVTPRLFGFISERLLDCWLETNGISYMELPVVNMESQNWPRKIAAFLKRKYAATGHKGE